MSDTHVHKSIEAAKKSLTDQSEQWTNIELQLLLAKVNTWIWKYDYIDMGTAIINILVEQFYPW